MNQKTMAIQRNHTARMFRHNSKIHRNCIILNSHNSEVHEKFKFKKCWELLKEGKEFLTEAKTLDGKRIADIVVLDDTLIIEIQNNESDESIAEKKAYYIGEGFEFESVKVFD